MEIVFRTMPPKLFLFALGLSMMVLVITSPPILRTLIPKPVVTPTPKLASPTVTLTPSPTLDPFAYVPTATPFGAGFRATEADGARQQTVRGEQPAALALLPTPISTLVLPTVVSIEQKSEPLPPATSGNAMTVLPDSVAAASHPLTPTQSVAIPPAPTPSGARPDRLLIPRLNLDVPVEAVGLVASDVAPDVLAWGVPAYRAAGWLNTSAPLGQPGNTVLDGHHNVLGEVFRDLWTLQAGDEITLMGEGQTRQYRVSEVLILPERDQPLAVRLANARYIQPTEDERLTLVTCWPYEDNSHRTVVVAFPRE